MGRAFIDRTGIVYGRLTAVEFLGTPEGKKKSLWRCRCSCGNITNVTTSNLAIGHTTSCGCKHIEVMKERRIYPKELKGEYGVWRSIKQRTGNASGKNAKWYAHIDMCPEWRDSFDSFLADMGKRPSKEHSIERKRNNEGYKPDNCIWATARDQANNRKTNVVLEHENQLQTIAQWSDVTEITPATIAARVRRGWSDSAAITQPLYTRIKNVAE